MGPEQHRQVEAQHQAPSSHADQPLAEGDQGRGRGELPGVTALFRWAGLGLEVACASRNGRKEGMAHGSSFATVTER